MRIFLLFLFFIHSFVGFSAAQSLSTPLPGDSEPFFNQISPDPPGVAPVPPPTGSAAGVALPNMTSGGLALPFIDSLSTQQYRTEMNAADRPDLSSADRFNSLRALRNRISSNLDAAKLELSQAEKRVALFGDSNLLQMGLDQLKAIGSCYSIISEGKTPPQPCPPFFGDPNFLKTQIAQQERQLVLVRESETRLPEARRKISELETIFDELDRKIGDAISRDNLDQKFKSDVSLYFSWIIGAMIVAFFILLFVDGEVRRSMFSTPSAIQFITLFSLVIAIILFGITGILEGKELSALLGGLSGYILGRYSSESGKAPNSDSAQQRLPPVNTQNR